MKKMINIVLLIVVLLFGSYQYLNSGTNTSCAFRNDKLLDEHYDKHGKDMGYDSPSSYLDGACDVVNDKTALHKKEDDNDDIYYLEDTNEYVIVSYDGYIRTYFLPDDGIAYFNRK